ncbi:MAG TPA: hypothetical protein VLM76_11310 [Patescibacteria group bacterium]|nr:hypothetical protein [Patescibacteria group bacterium]
MSGAGRDLDAELDALDARWDRARNDMVNAGMGQIAAVRAATDGRIAELAADPDLQALALARWIAAEARRLAPARLAAGLGMPKGAVPMHAPPLIEDSWRVEMFGELVTDGPPITAPAPWPGYQAGPGPVAGEKLDALFGDSLPAAERARLIAGVPALTIRAWQIIVRRDGIAPFIEARRDRGGRWEVTIRGLGSAPTAELVRQILPGLARIRRQITRAGGRPAGRAKCSDDEIRTAVAKYRRATGTTAWPPAKWLAHELGVKSPRTAESYLRRAKIGK